jgi:hypothetical protein
LSRITNSSLFQNADDLKQRKIKIRKSYAGFENVALGVAHVLNRFYYPVESEQTAEFYFNQKPSSQHTVNWFQIYDEKNFKYDSSLNKARLDKYFSFQRDNLALSLTESDCFHPLLGATTQQF